MDPTQTSQTAGLTPEQTYNLIMGQIEPELTTDMLPELDALYVDETPEEREERGKWYAIAFELFEERYKTFVEGWKSHYTSLRAKALALARKAEEKNDEGDIGAIESSLQTS